MDESGMDAAAPDSVANSGIRDLRAHYRTGKNNLARNFFTPCLAECATYLRASGFFSTNVLVTWCFALPRLLSVRTTSIRLLISPYLTAQDRDLFVEMSDEDYLKQCRRTWTEDAWLDALPRVASPESSHTRLQLFAWMYAEGRLDLRFAFPDNWRSGALFHEKIGVFTFPWGDEVAFTGSANETLGGYHRNYESIDVYRSWVATETDRVVAKRQQFEEAWENRIPGLDVYALAPDVASRLTAIAPAEYPGGDGGARRGMLSPNYQWRHQDEAVREFLLAERGVLEMATGTGKTRTALKILDKLAASDLVRSIVISAHGTDLLDQWRKELDQWVLGSSHRFQLARHYGKHHDLRDYVQNPGHTILLVSRNSLRYVLPKLDAETGQHTIVVHDEVHGFGSPSLRAELTGAHESIRYRLGLTATREREYDEDGNSFIEDEVGAVIYRFELESAIRRGILCEFDYVPLGYQLLDSDRERLAKVYKMRAAREKAGNPMTQEEVWIELSKVHKTAEDKIRALTEYVCDAPQTTDSCIVFAETKEYGNRTLEILHRYTYKYRTYYGEDDRQNLVDFANGKIDSLITCHRISEGIDIRSLERVVLLSSSRGRLETIQRIGRCLRADPANPAKRATVVDFVRPLDEGEERNNDIERATWLSDLARIGREE